ncbi:Hypp4267 [Branchiostoma lanceolatum]|uniref:Hypp4267 protein n=1 Tax=Branchiostoma lanceolatum TaxID=7740 RepID=A0A8K0F0D2_BRALA|nr:Hypp4267 [Branchiostoma lanceolatum]
MSTIDLSAFRFETLKVPSKAKIRDFVKDNKLEFAKGKGFYQLTKPETIQRYKEVVARRKTDGAFVSGDAVRKVLGIPKDDSNFSLNKKNIPDFDVFIQSTSYNRVLVPNTEFLYEVKASCTAGSTGKRKAKAADVMISCKKAKKDETVPSPCVPPHFPPGGPMEIVFSFDTTGSMGGCIAEVRREVQDIIRRLHADIPGIRIAIFAHGDYQDADSTYVTKWVDFTTDADKLCEFVRTVQNTCGYDGDECYELVLRQVRTELSWTPGTQRSLVLIGDADPHEPSYGLNTDNIDWREETDRLYNDNGVHIYAVQAGGGSSMAFYKDLANRTQGCHLKLENFSCIIDFLMAICYRERGPDQLMAYENEVRARYNAPGGPAMNRELHGLFDTLAGRDGEDAETDSPPRLVRASTPLLTPPSTPPRASGHTPSPPRTPTRRRGLYRRTRLGVRSRRFVGRRSPRIAARLLRRSRRIVARQLIFAL